MTPSYQLPRGGCQPSQARANGVPCTGACGRVLSASVLGAGRSCVALRCEWPFWFSCQDPSFEEKTASNANSIHSTGLPEHRVKCRRGGCRATRGTTRGTRSLVRDIVESSNATYGTQQVHFTVMCRRGETLRHRVPRTGGQCSQKVDSSQTPGLAHKLESGLQDGSSWTM